MRKVRQSKVAETCGCAALSTELPMAGYTTTGAAVEMEQAPPLCNGGQVQYVIIIDYLLLFLS